MWQVCAIVNGKFQFVGTYSTESQAMWAASLYGEDARIMEMENISALEMAD